ncbi:MAG: helix-turn-helix domain-containing protein [Dinoroseobacter sp.]|nr:helix-turn-helix domain-containing protein [Dinoroseobacter sp.]
MTSSNDHNKLFDCPVLEALKVISGKWKTRVLWLLRERPRHFSDLKRELPGVSAKVLTEQIQQLEHAQIIHRREVFRGGVRHVEYDYTEYGRTLVPALDQLGDWGANHSKRRPHRP